MLPLKYAVPVLLLTVPMLALASCQSSSSPDPAATMAAAATATLTPLPVATATTTGSEEVGEGAVTDGACLFTTQLGVSVGDTWTISGRIYNVGNAPEGFPIDAETISTTFSITAIESEERVTGDRRVGGTRTVTMVENARISTHKTNMLLDKSDEILNTEEQDGTSSSIRIGNNGPVLTLDWDCHRQAWLDSFSDGVSIPAVRETTLPSGINVIVFSVDHEIDMPAQEMKFTANRQIGYDKQTGKIVLMEFSSNGTQDGEPFSTGAVQQIVEDSSA